MNNLDELKDGDIIILAWSDGRHSVSKWNSDKANIKSFLIGWFENTEENYWRYIGSMGFE